MERGPSLVAGAVDIAKAPTLEKALDRPFNAAGAAPSLDPVPAVGVTSPSSLGAAVAAPPAAPDLEGERRQLVPE